MSGGMGYGIMTAVRSGMRPQVPPWVGDRYKTLVESCWNQDPMCRPKFTDIMDELKGQLADWEARSARP